MQRLKIIFVFLFFCFLLSGSASAQLGLTALESISRDNLNRSLRVNVSFNTSTQNSFSMMLRVHKSLDNGNITGGSDVVSLLNKSVSESSDPNFLDISFDMFPKIESSETQTLEILFFGFRIDQNPNIDCNEELELEHLSFKFSAKTVSNEPLEETRNTKVRYPVSPRGDFGCGIGVFSNYQVQQGKATVAKADYSAKGSLYFDLIFCTSYDKKVTIDYDEQFFDLEYVCYRRDISVFVLENDKRGSFDFERIIPSNPKEFMVRGGESKIRAYLTPKKFTTDENNPTKITFKLRVLRFPDELTECLFDTECGKIEVCSESSVDCVITGEGQPLFDVKKAEFDHAILSSGQNICNNVCSNKFKTNYYIFELKSVGKDRTLSNLTLELPNNIKVTRILVSNKSGSPIPSGSINLSTCGTQTSSPLSTSDIEEINGFIANYHDSPKEIYKLSISSLTFVGNGEIDFYIEFFEIPTMNNICGLGNSEYRVTSDFALPPTSTAITSSLSIFAPFTFNPCENYYGVFDRYFNLSGSRTAVFNSNQEGYVQISVYIENNFENKFFLENLVYELDANMGFTADDARFRIDANPDQTYSLSQTIDFSSFKSFNNFKNTDNKVRQFNFSKQSNGRIRIDRFEYETSPCLQRLTLVVLLKVKTAPKVSKSDNGYRSTVNQFPKRHSWSDITSWNNPSSFVLVPKVLLACGDQELFSGNIKPNQTFPVYYILENIGGDVLEKVNVDAFSPVSFGSNPSEIVRIQFFENNKSGERVNVEDFVLSDGMDVKGSINNYLLNKNLNAFHRFVFKIEYRLPPEAIGNTVETTFKSTGNNFGLELNVTEAKPLLLNVSATQSSCIFFNCSECVSSFSPEPGKRYLVSGWVKEKFEVTEQTSLPNTYLNSGVRLTFNNGQIDELGLITPSGPIIDGWQRIEKSFTVPAEAKNIQIELLNLGNNEVFFDDIRIHPFRSNMKSFVYDPSTQRLVAELDENNYATMYEYDDEGILIRVKKETERGVMTIKESRNNQSKIFK